MSTSRRAFLTGHWISGKGDRFCSINPATGAEVWEGRAATETDVGAAVAGARAALLDWSAAPLEKRIGLLDRYAAELVARKEEVADTICQETGKPFWEALGEVDAMTAKVGISIDAHRQRRSATEREQGGALSATRFKAVGVMAVFGPFNMPGHLPNGHIVPALLAGNTVVFKPSELTPGVGEKMAECLHHAGISQGVVSLIQGGRDVGELLARQGGVDGVLFTGSVAGGQALARSLVDQPRKMLALEMGGNNPLLVWEAGDIDAAARLTVLSAFITSGQRCSCARRLIVRNGASGEAFIAKLVEMTDRLRVGPYSDRPEPFMGTVITDAAADRLFAAQAALLESGAIALKPLREVGPRRAMLGPGILDVTHVAERGDIEHFGPLLQVIRVDSFDAAMAEANATAFGLAAGLLSDNADLWRRFYRDIRAGVVYWNRQTTGGSSQLPFGGIGASGNYRPSGYFAADYCSYPVASMESPRLSRPTQHIAGLE